MKVLFMQRNRRVCVVQEYVANYRKPFFDEIKLLLDEVGIEFIVAAGHASGTQARRGDSAAAASYVRHLNQRTFSVGTRRFTWRHIGPWVKSSDVLILEQARRNIDTYRLLCPWRRRKPQIVLWGHGQDLTVERSRVEDAVLRALTRRCDFFLGYTQASVEAVLRAGVPEGRTMSIQNSIDTVELRDQLASLTPIERRQLEQLYDLRGSTALFIGGLDAAKRVDFLLASGKVARQLNKNFRLLIVGAGVESNKVMAAAATSDWIQYLGPLTGREKAKALAVSDIMVIPGRVGLVALDGMVAGLPLVTTKGQLHGPEISYLQKAGQYIDSVNDEFSYAQRICSLLSSSSDLASRKLILEHESRKYSTENMAQNFVTGVLRAISL